MHGVVKMLSRRALICCCQPLSYSYVTALRKTVNHQMKTTLASKIVQVSAANLSGSSLFVSDRNVDAFSNFTFDHGLKARLKDKELLKHSLRQRGLNINVDQLDIPYAFNASEMKAPIGNWIIKQSQHLLKRLEQDYLRLLDLHIEIERLEENRETIAKLVAAIVKQQKANKTKSEELATRMKVLIQEGKDVKKSLKDIMVQYWNVEERVMLTALSLPNTLSDSVPAELEILEEYFTDRIPTSHVDHYQLLEQCNDIKLSNVGIKAYYLRGRLAVLEQELIRTVCSQLRGKSFTQMLAPEMFKTPVVESGGLDPSDSASVYKLQAKQGTKDLHDWDNDLLFLCGASPLSFLAFLSRMMVNKSALPVKMFTVGRNYSPGSEESQSQPGLFGVLQSTKICVCGVCSTEEDMRKLATDFISSLTAIYKQFNLPSRLVNVSALSLSMTEQNRIELQVWGPSIKKYITVASVSQCGDYSSRRLMIRHSNNNQLGNSLPVHMVHGEVIDITKMIGLLLEYGQTNSC